MTNRVEAKTVFAKGWTQSKSRDVRMPDMVANIADVGRTLLHHAEGMTLGYLPNRDNSDKKISLSIYAKDDEGEFDAIGFIHPISADDARKLAVGFNELADVADGRVKLKEEAR